MSYYPGPSPRTRAWGIGLPERCRVLAAFFTVKRRSLLAVSPLLGPFPGSGGHGVGRRQGHSGEEWKAEVALVSLLLHCRSVFHAHSCDPTCPTRHVLLASKAGEPCGPSEAVPAPSLRSRAVSKASSAGRAGSAPFCGDSSGPRALCHRQHTRSLGAFQGPPHPGRLPLLPERLAGLHRAVRESGKRPRLSESHGWHVTGSGQAWSPPRPERTLRHPRSIRAR